MVWGELKPTFILAKKIYTEMWNVSTYYAQIIRTLSKLKCIVIVAHSPTYSQTILFAD